MTNRFTRVVSSVPARDVVAFMKPRASTVALIGALSASLWVTPPSVIQSMLSSDYGLGASSANKASNQNAENAFGTRESNAGTETENNSETSPDAGSTESETAVDSSSEVSPDSGDAAGETTLENNPSDQGAYETPAAPATSEPQTNGGGGDSNYQGDSPYPSSGGNDSAAPQTYEQPSSEYSPGTTQNDDQSQNWRQNQYDENGSNFGLNEDYSSDQSR